jgi:acetyl esterase
MVLPPCLLAIGTLVPGIPYASTIGMWLFPTASGPLLPIALAGALVAHRAARRGARRVGTLFALVGALTASSAGAVIARHAQTARANGVSINLLATIVPRLASVGAAPDESVFYTRVDGHDLGLDIYRPAITTGAAPVAIHIHGGGWNAGDRKVKAANVRWFADHGFLGISVDYGLATAERATWQTAAAQVTCALSWVSANAGRYGGDPDRVFVFGESAGGALALTTGYAAAAGVSLSSCDGTVPPIRAVAAQVPGVDPVTAYGNPDPIGGPRVREMVRWYLGGTPADHPDEARAVSSATYVSPQAPPTLLVLSDDDHLVPIEGALRFIDRARQAGVSVRVVRFRWADHGVAALYYSVANQTWLQTTRQHFCRHGGACG